MEAHSSPGGKYYPAMEIERPREGSSRSPYRNRERHMIDIPACTHHSMSTQISRQMTNRDFLVKRVGLGKITTQDASTQLPEMSKGPVGWNLGENSRQPISADAAKSDLLLRISANILNLVHALRAVSGYNVKLSGTEFGTVPSRSRWDHRKSKFGLRQGACSIMN
jgi:hypothetical protein